MRTFKKYKSKFDNYPIDARIDDLKRITDIQCSKGNYDVDEYMRGMANGLLLAWGVIHEPYGHKQRLFDQDNKMVES